MIDMTQQQVFNFEVNRLCQCIPDKDMGDAPIRRVVERRLKSFMNKRPSREYYSTDNRGLVSSMMQRFTAGSLADFVQFMDNLDANNSFAQLSHRKKSRNVTFLWEELSFSWS